MVEQISFLTDPDFSLDALFPDEHILCAVLNFVLMKLYRHKIPLDN